MHLPIDGAGVTLLEAIFGTLTALIGLVTAILVAQRKVHGQLSAIHVLVNGNLSQVMAELKATVARMETLQRQMDAVTDVATEEVTTPEEAQRALEKIRAKVVVEEEDHEEL